MTKNGRRGKYRNVGHYHWGGKEIVGLKRRPDGRFYAANQPNKTFGKDPALAVHRFRLWQQTEAPPKEVPFLNKQKPGDYLREEWRYLAENHADPERREYYRELSEKDEVVFKAMIPLEGVKGYFRDLILTDAKRAAVELDIPELAYFDQLRPPPPPTMTLTELGEKYLTEKRNGRGKPLSDKHKKLSRQWWGEFVDFVGVKHATEITESKIDEYGLEILSRFDKGKSQAYVKHRFGKVKAVLAFGIKKGIDSHELNRVLQVCLRRLETPAPPLPDPKPISPTHFKALLGEANVRQKAILLTALNLCMKSGEVADLDKADCDLKKGTVVTHRSKTGVTRVGVLWQRTVEAIRECQKKHPHRGEHLFNSRIGTRLTAKAAGRIVIQLRRKAGLPEAVNFDTIRDGGYTAAIEGGASEVHARLLAGHKVKMSDQYVRRNPRMVADACEAIEASYFGGSQQRSKKPLRGLTQLG